MRRLCAILFAMIAGAMVLMPVMADPVYAADPQPQTTCGTKFLGLRPWYQGLTVDGDCSTIKKPANDSELPLFVWTAILNVMSDLFVIGGLAALGFLIWGGFKYIMSNGDPGQVATAKKTITSAVIGLVITVLASVIANTIINVLLSARGAQ